MNEPTCVDCGQELTLVRPGKHQCDNPNCIQNNSKPESVRSCGEPQEFDGSVQFELDFGDRFIRVNCPDEDDDIHILIKRNKKYAGLSLGLDQAEELARYILGHINNARISNP